MSLKQLLILQHEDQQLLELKGQLTQLPHEKAKKQKAYQAQQESVLHLREKIEKKERARQGLVGEVAFEEELLARYKRQQLETRSNEEYTAFAEQMEHVSHKINLAEEAQLSLMEQIDELQQQLLDEEALVTQAKLLYEKGVALLRQQSTALEQRYREHLDQRKKVAATLKEKAPELLEEYLHLFKKKGSSALVPLHDGVCGGCHMEVTRQTRISVESEKGIHHCDHCGRILYLEG